MKIAKRNIRKVTKVLQLTPIYMSLWSIRKKTGVHIDSVKKICELSEEVDKVDTTSGRFYKWRCK